MRRSTRRQVGPPLRASRRAHSPGGHYLSVMTRPELLELMRRPPYWVEASVAATGAPQAAVVGVVVTERVELFFDTLVSTRKLQNLRRDPRVALVAWEGEVTVQVEGVADEPAGDDLARLKALYFARFPDGRDRERWPGIAYVRVRPSWIRHSDFSGEEPRITELTRADLAGIAAAVPGSRFEDLRCASHWGEEILMVTRRAGSISGVAPNGWRPAS